MSERLVFFNSLPQLYRTLKKEQQEQRILGLISDFLKNSFREDLAEKVERFLKIPGIGFIPADMEYFKLYSELMQLYTNGLFYSTIVLSGVLCERICYDILSKQKIRLGKELLSEKQIACLYDLRLVDLIELLFQWGMIKKETRDDMQKIRKKRNQYVHPKKGKINKQQDSLKMIERVTRILQNEFEIRVKPMATVKLA